MSRRPTVGLGYVRFRTARERDEAYALVGRPLNVKLQGLTFDIYPHAWAQLPGTPSWGAMPLPGTLSVVSRGSDVLRELRAGRSWPGTSVNGYRLRVTRLPASGRVTVAFGCWDDYLDNARAVLEAAERAARRKRPANSGTTFAGRRAAFTSAGTTLLHKYRSSETTEEHAVRLPLRHLRLLVSEADRASRDNTRKPRKP